MFKPTAILTIVKKAAVTLCLVLVGAGIGSAALAATSNDRVGVNVTSCTAAPTTSGGRDTLPYQCPGTATQWVIGTSPALTCYAGGSVPSCDATRDFSCNQGACVCKSNRTLCSATSTCVVTLACGPGTSFDPCTNSCTTPNVLLSPAAQQTGSINVSGGITATGAVTAGSLVVTSGAGAGKVLQSDASGNAAWTTPAGGMGGLGTVGRIAKFSSGSAVADSLMLEDADGVGINLADPAALLHVAATPASGTVATVAAFTNAVSGVAGTGARIFLSGTSNASSFNRGVAISGINMGSSNGHSMTFETSANSASPTERMRITNQGRVGIGTPTPAVALDVVGDGQFSAGLTVAGNISVPSATSTVTVGNTMLGNSGTNASFQNSSASQYGLYQDTAGRTMLNSVAGQSLALRLGNVDRLILAASGNMLNLIGATVHTDGFALDGKLALSGGYSSSWLRLNSASNFTSGVYTPGLFRADGGIIAAADTDTLSTIGRADIGCASYPDYACFSHVDQDAAGSYALLQSSGGTTYLNTPAGGSIRFRSNNSDKWVMDTNGNLTSSTSNITTDGWVEGRNGVWVSDNDGFVSGGAGWVATNSNFWAKKDQQLDGGLYIYGGINGVGAQKDNVRFNTARAADGAYEWAGFYSGSTRQGIIIYDGNWDGCSSPSDLCIKAENGNDLNLKSDYIVDLIAPTIYSHGNHYVTGNLNVTGGITSNSFVRQSTYTVYAKGLGSGDQYIYVDPVAGTIATSIGQYMPVIQGEEVTNDADNSNFGHGCHLYLDGSNRWRIYYFNEVGVGQWGRITCYVGLFKYR